MKRDNIENLICYKIVYKKDDYYYCKVNENFQKYEIGKTYTMPASDLKICKSGFHACLNLEDCFEYHDMLSYKAILECQANDTIVYNTNDNSKIATNNLTIVKELSLKEIDSLLNYEKLKVNTFQNSKVLYRAETIQDSSYISNSDCVQNSESVNYSYGVVDGTQISNSNCVKNSELVYHTVACDSSSFVMDCRAVSNSKEILNSEAIRLSNHIYNSSAVFNSKIVFHSQCVKKSLFVRECSCIQNSIFCYREHNNSYMIFNKKVSEERFEKVYDDIKDFIINKLDITLTQAKREYNKEYRDSLRVNLQKYNDANKDGLIKIKENKNFMDYIESLVEYDDDIFNSIIK